MIVAIIASTRRPETLHDTLCSLAEQTRRPDLVIVSIVQPADFDNQWPEGLTGKVIQEAKGCSAQRNAGLRYLLPETKLVVFLDDDVTLATDCFANAERILQEMPDLALFSGPHLRDGDVTHAEARELLAQTPHPSPATFSPTDNCYGCMLFTTPALLAKEQFDERLVGYSMLADVDFARRALRHGRVGYHSDLSFVHLKVGSGRINDGQLGYSQIVVPYYLCRKGSIGSRELVEKCWLASLGANTVYSVFGGLRGRNPSFHQRRLVGNLHGVREIVFGKATPERCVHF